MSLRAGASLCAILLIVLCRPAHAALTVCNQTSYVLYAATGSAANGLNSTQGWTRIVPGDCKPASAAPLTAAFNFLYARSSQAHSGPMRAWGGNTQLCARDTNFSLKLPATSPDCGGGDAFTLPFAPLDNRHQQNWTTTLTESPEITDADKARGAGIARLLHDLGYKFTDAKGRDAAIHSFAKKQRLAANAGAAGLFDALETAAMKTASPAGYSVCNDTSGAVWTALAFRSGNSAVSAGWWKIEAGACAHALTEPLRIDHVYVHAEGHNKPALVSGKDKFCLTNITFQVTGLEDCRKRGLGEAGFAATNTQGVSGFTVHIGENGLVAPAPQIAGMPK